MDHPSNISRDKWLSMTLDDDYYDFSSNEARWYLVHQLDARHGTDKEWAETCSNEYRASGETLADILRRYWGWKSGDLKNGWKSVKLNNDCIDLTFDDFRRPLTIDANGIAITQKHRTMIIYNQF